jgi:hypothetical protein
MCNFSYGDIEVDGRFPGNVGVGRGSDYISVKFCLDCGKIQGPSFPVSDEDIKEACGIEDEVDEEEWR